MQKISPYLWFDNNAKEAVDFYVKIFPKSKINSEHTYKNSGPNSDMDVYTVDFNLNGFQFMAMNAGPDFKFTPAISFFVTCKTTKEVDELFEKLSSDGGSVLMALGKYPFSEKYAWVNDRFGVSWQLFMGENKQKIMPAMLFTQDKFGMLEEAMDFYTDVFEKGSVNQTSRYGDEEPTQKGKIMYAHFTLDGVDFVAMESNKQHPFTFNEAVSLYIKCKDQTEVDYFWEKLTDGGQEQPCGWVKDKYGVSWQIVPEQLDKLMRTDEPGSARAMAAMMQMQKLDIQQLQDAYDGK
ncbi:MAG TPA: VOC family protein [Acidobacteriota bacterium]|nr:VOC family protein [Acidobacteriota bacterium]